MHFHDQTFPKDMKRLYQSDSDGGDDNIDLSPNSMIYDFEHVNNRKKRRGIIEKRRRDRINHSLAELRRLVPQAIQKEGSTKLEKAEILQMTVEHLRTLQQKDSSHWTFDSTDYRSIGFRECIDEVSRYLISNEGFDVQHPLRLRLLSHLECFTDRDVNNDTKTTTVIDNEGELVDSHKWQQNEALFQFPSSWSQAPNASCLEQPSAFITPTTAMFQNKPFNSSSYMANPSLTSCYHATFNMNVTSHLIPDVPYNVFSQMTTSSSTQNSSDKSIIVDDHQIIPFHNSGSSCTVSQKSQPM
ncbi:unnamed protein product [Didymodactylos carnosus]|uniref:Hairy/enhancer-of-split related with YRPW motif protein n=1 Tax=Didymodactylos carnosus TaxID=1234261 RepID=A0A813UFW6_9BILA|nr:unnamed protein product [Didymodactylos carnosus]CAF0823145.1 unnamed protein product [Didymodactylos carnosus]CAF3571623.1 unnamed protein product [Didymodactylos carnosus]CAF3609724.1 unnamed protein product [Didymodactylos carnosus]